MSTYGGHASRPASLQELLSQQRSLQKLVARNANAPAEALLAHASDGGPTPLQLPFIIIQARRLPGEGVRWWQRTRVIAQE